MKLILFCVGHTKFVVKVKLNSFSWEGEGTFFTSRQKHSYKRTDRHPTSIISGYINSLRGGAKGWVIVSSR